MSTGVVYLSRHTEYSAYSYINRHTEARAKAAHRCHKRYRPERSELRRGEQRGPGDRFGSGLRSSHLSEGHHAENLGGETVRHWPSGLAAFGYVLFGIACVMPAAPPCSKIVGTVATLVAFAAVVWTAHETAAPRSQAERQTELEQRPLLIIEANNGDALQIKNVGRGVRTRRCA